MLTQNGYCITSFHKMIKPTERNTRLWVCGFHVQDLFLIPVNKYEDTHRSDEP